MDKIVYSGVVYLSGIWLHVFISEINKMETWDTDIVNSHIEEDTFQKKIILSGTKFGDK